MKFEYERVDFIITEFEIEDLITTSDVTPDTLKTADNENSYRNVKSLRAPNAWF